MTKQTLFTQKDCVPLPSDLVGEILVLRTDFFFDEYKRRISACIFRTRL